MSNVLTGFTSDNKNLGPNSKFVRRVNAMNERAAATGIGCDPRFHDAVAAFLTGPTDLPAFTGVYAA